MNKSNFGKIDEEKFHYLSSIVILFSLDYIFYFF